MYFWSRCGGTRDWEHGAGVGEQGKVDGSGVPWFLRNEGLGQILGSKGFGAWGKGKGQCNPVL